jgi:NitT/TauT family transport system substrate-binding protein
MGWKKKTGAVLTAAAMVMLSAGCGAGAQGASGGSEGAADAGSPTVTLGVQDPQQELLLDIAIKQGFLGDSGIEKVESRVFTSVPAMLSAVAKGQIEMAVQTLPAAWNYNQSTNGNELRVLGGNGTNTTRITVPTGSQEPKTTAEMVQSWKGKKIGLPVLAGLNFDVTKMLVTENGLDPEKDMQLAAIGTAGAAVAALNKGVVDVLVQGSTVAAMAEDQGAGFEVLSGDQLPNSGVLQIGYLASEQAIEADEARYQAIAEGIEQAKDWYDDEANKDAVVELYKSFDYTAELASLAYDSDHKADTYSDDMDQEFFDRSIAYMERAGSFPNGKPTWDGIMAGFLKP